MISFLECRCCEYTLRYYKSFVELHLLCDYIQSFDLDVIVSFMARDGESWLLEYAIDQPELLTPMYIERRQKGTETVYDLNYDDSLLIVSDSFAQLITVLQDDVRTKYKIQQRSKSY